jgi:hypothetical protein
MTASCSKSARFDADFDTSMHDEVLARMIKYLPRQWPDWANAPDQRELTWLNQRKYI